MEGEIPRGCLRIVDTGNHYLAAVKGNQPTLYRSIQEEFIPEKTNYQVNKGQGVRFVRG